MGVSVKTLSLDEMLELPPDPLSGGSSKPAPLARRVPSGAGMIAGDAFQGASVRDRQLALWKPALRSADADMLPNKRLADARVRDTIRNDAYVDSAETINKDSIVGSQFLLNAKPATKILLGREDETWEEEFQEEVETLFTLGTEGVDCWLDSARSRTFTEHIRLGVGTFFATGEYLAAVEWARDDADRRPFNTSIRPIDLDRLSTPPLRLNDPYVIGGVEVDKRHIPVAYHVRKAHPTDYMLAQSYEWERIQARKLWGRKQMLHIFEARRPGQTRGMSCLVTALKEMRQTKDFREIVLQNAVVSATYAATIESDLPTAEIFTRLGGGNMSADDINEATKSFMGSYLSAMDETIGDSNNLKMDGVKIPVLPPGSKLSLHKASQGGPLGTEFEKSLLRYIAASLGISYEQLSRDYSSTNYSSARAAMGETWKFFTSRKAIIADRLATEIYRLWLEEMLNRGAIQSMPTAMRRNTSWIYEPFKLEAASRCQWIGAGRGQIDPLKETQAAVLRESHNITNLEQEIGQLGGDWRTVLKQRRREKKLLEEYGLLPEPSNAMNAASGSKSANEAPAKKSDSSQEKKAKALNGSLEKNFHDADHSDVDEVLS